MPEAQLVADIIRALEAIDGQGHWVGGQYVPRASDVGLVRERLARQLARKSDVERDRQLGVNRLWAAGEVECVFCNCELYSLTGVVALGSRLLHKRCAEEHSDFAADTVTADARYEITDAGLEALDDYADLERAS